MEAFKLDLKDVDLKDPVVNIIFNLAGGLQVKDLSESEKECLKKKFGVDVIADLEGVRP